MLTFDDIKTLKSLYKDNINVIQYLKESTHLPFEEAILHSYDLQAGSYIKELTTSLPMQINKEQVGLKLANILKDLSISVVCEAGIGEATTLGNILPHISLRKKWGFDISMSRLLYSKKYLEEQDFEVDLFCAEMSNIPFMDDTLECVYTFHSLEPNAGREKSILTELLRITQKYLILIEPDYDRYSKEQKYRMDQHGYCKNIRQHLQELNAKITHDEPWELDSYNLNKASLIIIEKNTPKTQENHSYVSPISFQPLSRVAEGYFCQEDGFLFPSIQNIPNFIKKNAILVSRYQDISHD
jgi:ubiquinone/menaquinone biosynthesis C-methylase UbiE